MGPFIFTDFDGTISERDTLVHLLDHYVGPSWLEIEDRVDAGTLSEEQGLRQEIALLTPPFDEARDLVLREVPVDSHFAGFAALCQRNRWPLEILSGGIEPLIRAYLGAHGLAGIPLRANGLEFEADGRWRVRPAQSPRISELCNHCKTHWVRLAAESHRVIYIGDGCTDRCPGAQADLLFAKGSLSTWCAEREIEHVRFEHFGEITGWLSGEPGRAWLSG